MPQLLQSSVVCTSNNSITVLPVSKSDKLNNALLISCWCYFSNFNSKHDDIIFSVNPCSLNLFSRIFGTNTQQKLFKNITLKVDYENNHRLKMQINNDINIPIQSQNGLQICSWNHITFVLSCNPLIILFKLNNEYFETQFKQNGTIYDLDLSHYNLTISSSKQNNPGFNGLFGSLFYDTFKLQNKSQYIQETDYKQKYLNILIQENIEQNTKFILNINNNNYGYGNHHKLSSKQHSLITLNQLLEHQCDDHLNVSTESLTFCKWENMFIDDVINGYKTGKIKALSPPTRNLICVCHDMAGGYHHDANSFGNHIYNNNNNNNNKQLPFEYHIEYWCIIDIFVYFSHDFITIPPIQWIENAHKNETLILGTLITEHQYGTKLTHQIIENKTVRQRVVNKLVEIAVFYGFDGWFLNFESDLNNNNNQMVSINNLILFVRELTNELHKKMAYGKVIWYDSVSSKTGKVQWQSRLNHVNIPFFNECDGLFTDYHWKKQYPLESVQFASKYNREHAVFTGIDIWGRGTFGDGGYKTGNIMHYLLNGINDNNKTIKTTSIGLFATGWTFEHEVNVSNQLRKSLNDNYCNDYDVELFRMNEKKFWCGINYFIYQCNKQNEWNVNKIGKDGWEINKDNDLWIASYQWCMRQINIDLNSKFNMNRINNKRFKIMIKQSVAGTGPNFADLYHLTIEFKNFNGNIIKKIDNGQMIMTKEWKHLLFEYHVTENNKVTNIVITERAKDVEYWAGHFGTKLKSPVIIIIFDEVKELKDNNNNVSIIDAIKIKNNKSFGGYDTFLYFDPKLNEDKLFFINTFSVGFGKKYVNPSLNDIGITNQYEIIDHCWYDLSMQDSWNKNLKLTDNNYNDEDKEDNVFDDEDDEELIRKAIAMSMMTQENDDNEENKKEEEKYSNNNWRVRSCFDDAFIGGHCIEFQSGNIMNDNGIFMYPLHCIQQNKYIDNKALISLSFAMKQNQEKGCLFYLTINYIDSSNNLYTIKCKDELDKNNILILCGHVTKQYNNNWKLHTFDFKINKNETIKLKGINANISTTNKSMNYNVYLGYISISIQPVVQNNNNDSNTSNISNISNISMDDEKTRTNQMVIDHIPTINDDGNLDNIIKIDWNNCFSQRFKMMNIYLINSNYKINDNVNNKWFNSMQLQQFLGDKSVENIEWLLSTKYNKKQLLINNSLISCILKKWENKHKNDNKTAAFTQKMLLFEITDLKYYKQHSSKWSIIKLQNINQS